jgi:hypothetical protein
MSCIYCGSNVYGRPCLFSPTNTHVIMDDPGKCIYCGSPYLGGGCLFNPYGKMHVRGPEFLNRSSVLAEKAILLKYMLDKMQNSKHLNETANYKSPLDRFYRQIIKIVSSISEPLLEALNLREIPTHVKLSKENIIKSYQYKQKFKKELDNLNKVIQEAHLEMPPELVEESLLYAIINTSGNKD